MEGRGSTVSGDVRKQNFGRMNVWSGNDMESTIILSFEWYQPMTSNGGRREGGGVTIPLFHVNQLFSVGHSHLP